MPEPVEVGILPDDVYRIIEALEYYVTSWEATETCRRHGYQPDDDPIHVWCYDPDEAHRNFLTARSVLRRFNREVDRIARERAD